LPAKSAKWWGGITKANRYRGLGKLGGKAGFLIEPRRIPKMKKGRVAFRGRSVDQRKQPFISLWGKGGKERRESANFKTGRENVEPG